MNALASRIPNHPQTCKGVSAETYDESQCRLCWLATYDPDYQRIWNIPTQQKSNTIKKLSGGVGTELTRLLSWLNIKKTESCHCAARAAEMDRRGIEWCAENVETICNWLKQSAQELKFPFNRAAANLAIHAAIRAAKAKRPDDVVFPCVYRDTKRVTAPGCSDCSGIPYVHPCSNPTVAGEFCVINGTERTLSSARGRGFLVCSECGVREPEFNLEMPIAKLRLELDNERRKFPPGWEDWKATEHAVRESFFELIVDRPPPRKTFSGKGIVISAGGETYFRSAIAVVHTLKRLGCDLPIELWYLGDNELDARMLRLAESWGVRCRDLMETRPKPKPFGGWESKPLSVMHSDFQEVLYLDADCVPVVDPTYLFDDPAYVDNGSLFWPDLPPLGREWIPESVWERFGLVPSSYPDFESGQFIIDKHRCWKELCVTTWLNQQSDYVYRHVHGDKSTFHLAWWGCGSAFGMPSKLPTWEHPTIYQYDPQGKLVFQHACKAKTRLATGVRIPSLVNAEYVEEGGKFINLFWKGLYQYPNDLAEKTGKLTWDSSALPGTKNTFDVRFEANFKLQGGPPEACRWGWDGERIAIVGRFNKTNTVVTDWLINQNGIWQGTIGSLTFN